MKLSVLIPTVKENKRQLDNLLATLLFQIKDLDGEIEVFICGDSTQEGAKMNHLLRDAQGKYVWFLNDYDLVSETAIQDIFKATESEPDIIGIFGCKSINGKAEDWNTSLDSENKICFNSPMKREHALLKPFRKKKINAFEIWVKDILKISPFIKEVIIEKPIVRKNLELTVVK